MGRGLRAVLCRRFAARRPARPQRGAAGARPASPRGRRLRPAGDGARVDRLRRRLRPVLAADLRAPRDRRRRVEHDRPAAAARRRRGDRLLRPQVPARVGTPAKPFDAGDDPGEGGQDLRPRRRLDRLPDARDRRERALRRRPRHALERDEHAVPRRRPRLPDATRRARRRPVPPDLEAAVHRRRRGRLVDAGREGREHRPGGLLQRAAALRSRGRSWRRAGCASRSARRSRTYTALGIPASRVGIVLGFQVAAGAGGREHLAAVVGLVPRREVAGARREAGRGGDRRRHGLVVGLGDVGRRLRRPGQARRRLRLPLGARPVASATARHAAGRRLRRVAHRGPDPRSRAGRAARSPASRSPTGRSPASPRSPATRARRERALRPARHRALGAGQHAPGARRGGGDRRDAVPRAAAPPTSAPSPRAHATLAAGARDHRRRAAPRRRLRDPRRRRRRRRARSRTSTRATRRRAPAP